MNPWQPPSRTLGQPHQAEGDLLRNLPVPLLPQTITDTPTGLSRGQPQGPSLYSPFSSTGSPNYALVKTPLSSPTSEDTLPPHATYKEKEHVQRKRHWDTVMLEPTDDPLDHSPIFSAGSSTGIPSVHDGLPQRSHSFFGEERILRPFGIIPEQAPRMESLLETMLTASSKPVLEETPPLTPSNSGSLSQAEELMVEQIAAASSTPRLGVSSKQKRFQCHLCGSTFAQRGDMIRHIRVKGNIKVLSRELCYGPEK